MLVDLTSHYMALWILVLYHSIAVHASMENVLMTSRCTDSRHVGPEARITPTLKISKRKRKILPEIPKLEKGLSADINTAPIPKIHQRKKPTLLEYLENIPQFEREDFTFPLHKTVKKNTMKNDFVLIRKKLDSIMDDLDADGMAKTNCENDVKLEKYVEELKSIHGFMLFQAQCEILRLKRQALCVKRFESACSSHENMHLEGVPEMPKGLPIFSVRYPKSSNEVDLNEDMMGILINKKFISMIGRLNVILHDLNLFHDKNTVFLSDGVDETATKMQNLVFQMVSSIYKQNLITKTQLRDFFEKHGTLELASINMITYFKIQQNQNTNFSSSRVILKNWNSSHFRTFLEVIEEKKRRYFSYLSLKAFFDYSGDLSVYDALGYSIDEFMNEKFFNTLENYFEAKTKSVIDLEKFRAQNEDYTWVKEQLNNLRSLFLDDYYHFHNPETRKFSFSILELVQENYGDEILFTGEEDTLFKLKLSFMSSNFNFYEEISNLNHYINKNLFCKLDSKENDSHEPKDVLNQNEELDILHQYLSILLSNKPQIIMHESLKHYSLLPWMNKLETEIKNSIIHKNIPVNEHNELLKLEQVDMLNLGFLQHTFQNMKKFILNQAWWPSYKQ
ncbi:hypothetical protein PGT21_004205 [Puccinia graminis f. sp. tritici]|uniref:Uncharacterized protein n=1 Tax=Puccinia graminis f. sp. tritici TaxID=56615 RepID=A0A5B0N9H4_PUCGR|nr:hypothetical protein PGT21_004205 [Puccinia graminis f. sp. tritici]KAA1118448.1 hypothetical protein PGTUg99_006737 [Puccinia graminis f. sp. tritici]